jgi:hypothetical protein
MGRAREGREGGGGSTNTGSALSNKDTHDLCTDNADVYIVSICHTHRVTCTFNLQFIAVCSSWQRAVLCLKRLACGGTLLAWPLP